MPLVVDGGVVFSHGIGVSRRGYSYLGQHWASHGVASLHLQHIGSDRNVWFGNPLGMIGRLQDAAQDGEAIARAQDLRFALDQLLGPGSELAPHIDAERIAAAGHSYGANTVLLAAGARAAPGPADRLARSAAAGCHRALGPALLRRARPRDHPRTGDRADPARHRHG